MAIIYNYYLKKIKRCFVIKENNNRYYNNSSETINNSNIVSTTPEDTSIKSNLVNILNINVLFFAFAGIK